MSKRLLFMKKKCIPSSDHCSSGFHSPIRCGGGGGGTHSDECPVGLICEPATRFCCPFPPKQQQKKRKLAAVTLPAAQWPRALSSANSAKGNRRRMALRRHDLCPTGAPALGPCAPGFCVAPMQCAGALCCAPPAVVPPPPPPVAYGCPGGMPALGPCIGGRCASPGTLCASPSNVCCAQSVPTAIPATGRCDNNQQCAEPGYACDVANNWCCPQVIGDAIGPCIQGEGGNRLCPEGYACVGEGEGQCFRLDTGTCAPEEQSGPCAPDGSCPPGYECIEGFCCQTDVGAPAPPTAAAAALRFRQRRRRAVAPAATAFLGMVRRSK
uniref:CC domain-containing protein n=1 Tax=Globodera pallida TaxID=36090 RepID=A0A183BJQ0_GLOPA